MADFIQQIDGLSRAMKVIPAKMGAEAVKFSKQRFQQKNWVDNTTRNWAARKPNADSKQRKTRGVLTDSGRLRRSIRKISATNTRIVIGTDVPYAQIHNEGGRVSATQRVRSHNRKSHKRAGITIRSHKVNGFTRKISFTMRERRFLGNSAVLARRIERIAVIEFKKALN